MKKLKIQNSRFKIKDLRLKIKDHSPVSALLDYPSYLKRGGLRKSDLILTIP